MNIVTSLLGLMFVALFGLGASAQALEVAADPTTECTDIVQRVGAFQIHRYQGTLNCFFSALPVDNPANYYLYRSYLFSEKGLLMIFNSYEGFDESDGARVFMLFPRNQVPTLEVVDGRSVMKSATKGIELILESKKSIIYGMNGGKAIEDYSVTPYNKGGVEFTNVQTLILDSGFKIGEIPTGDFQKKSTFKDINGNTCTVKNGEVYKTVGSGDVAFRFSDQELKTFLAKRCPNIFANW